MRPSAGSANARPLVIEYSTSILRSSCGRDVGGVALGVVEAAQLDLHPLRRELRTRCLRVERDAHADLREQARRRGQRLLEPAAPQQGLDAQPLEIDRLVVLEQLRRAAVDRRGFVEQARAHVRVRLMPHQIALAGGVPRPVRERDLVELGGAAKRERLLGALRGRAPRSARRSRGDPRRASARPPPARRGDCPRRRSPGRSLRSGPCTSSNARAIASCQPARASASSCETTAARMKSCAGMQHRRARRRGARRRAARPTAPGPGCSRR